MRNRKSSVAASVVVAALVALVAVAFARDQSAPTKPAPQGTAALPQPVRAANVKLAIASGQKFLGTYVAPNGRVIRRDQGGDTVSEGQAYGLLIAVAVDNRERFDAIWRWTQQNLQRPDALLSSLWAGGKVTDPLPATDADLDAARALLIAAQRWQEPRYRTEALAIGESILLRETIDVTKRKFLVAGPWARAAPAVVNPSYFSPRAYDALYAATGDRRWQQLQETGLETIDGLTTNAPSLPPDWARVHGTQVVPSYQPRYPEKGVRYAYEAARVMPRYAEMCAPAGPDPGANTASIGRRLVARAWPFMRAQGPDGPTADLRADGRAIGGNRNALATVAAAATADAAGDFDARDRLLEAAQRIQDQALNYYGGAWMALGRIMLTTDLLGSCNAQGAIS